MSLNGREMLHVPLEPMGLYLRTDAGQGWGKLREGIYVIGMALNMS